MRSKNILVVDDLPDWRTTLSGILFEVGYQVFTASNHLEAIQIVEQQPIHLAVLDVRLDETNEDNREGLALMRAIKDLDPNILIIILTGYADVKMVQEARNPGEEGMAPAYSFIEKENTDTLLSKVATAFETRIKVNWELVVENFVGCNDLIEIIRFTYSAKPDLDILNAEIEELLGRLFFDCDKIYINNLLKGFSGAAVFSVSPYYKGRGAGENVVVKIGEKSLIQKEIDNYKNWVEGTVGGHRLPKQLQNQNTRSLSGLIYSFAGLGSSREFASVYQESSFADIAALLENLFLETCFPASRKQAIPRPHFNFTSHYAQHLKIQERTLKKFLNRLIKSQNDLVWANQENSELIFNNTVILPNPVQFILNTPIIDETILVTVHGDLTPYNILVDHHNEAWLIDFSHTGQGHLLQDFARLEAFIKFFLLPHYELNLLFTTEKELINSVDLKTYHVPDEESNDQALFKMYATVGKIRQLAQQVAKRDALKEYLTALLFNTIRIITILQLPTTQKIFAILSAALICKRLKELESDWR